ncbi:branched-chain amino acid ABC transporter permease [Rhodoligotrophos defluvii]|uniref:branched-chain amino acid ABC transporter permease n=1 Tax=Rhodoligotrophos defluvii TaxID=2561934 RepID=UPI0010C9C482|nr:branched-chain amino acid ABC transporter permease [Rhodoligotrophos defluvii]
MSDTVVERHAKTAAGWRSVSGDIKLAAVLFALLALVPAVIGGYAVYILPQYLLFGVLAMSLGLLWGLGGIVSFGQAAFFAIGGYSMGLAMQAGFGPAGAYLGLICAALAGAVLAGLAGYFLFSAGVRATYFVLVTLALSIIVEQAAVSQSQLTGGWNGMFVDRMSLNFGPLGEISLYEDAAAYYFILPIVALIFFGLRALSVSRFGKILVGIRENEDRMMALGYSVSFYKTLAFSLSGALAGFAGALYATHANFVSPSLAGVLFSTEVVVWVAIGGRTSLLGALLGGVAVSALSNYLSSVTPEYWQLVLGIIFVLVILFFKEGLAGLARSLADRLHRTRADG